jgi:hypothetical protein
MKKYLLLFILLFSRVPAQKSDTIITNNLNQDINYRNSLNWASSKTKDFLLKDITIKDQSLGLVTEDIKVQLYQDSGCDFAYSANLKIESKDNKFRITILNNAANVSLSSIDYSTLGPNTIRRYRDNLKAVIDLSKDYFENKLVWDCEKLDQLVKENQLNDLQKNIVEKVLNSVKSHNIIMIKDIENEMAKNDNW